MGGERRPRGRGGIAVAADYVDQVAGAIIKQLQEGTASWQKPWNPGERFMPYNPTTGNEYRGANALWLMSQAESKGFGDARWMTYRQAQEQDAQVTKGQKGTAIQYWKWQGLEPVKDASGKPVLDQQGEPVKQVVRYERPRVWSAVVFNAQQIDGLPPAPDRPAMAEWQRHEKAEAIIANSGVPVLHAPGDRAFYRLSEDKITLPERGQFASADRYYATALHELGHATGHPTRLARDMAHPFGSEGYAREELRAEIGSMMLGEQLGIGHDPSQHVAYVGSWIKALQQDPREVFRAAADAEKITKMVRSFELVQEQEAPEQVRDAEAERARITTPARTTPWQRPELAPAARPAQPASHYAGMIATHTGHLPPEICSDAVARMVDFAAPDIVLAGETLGMRHYHRSVAVGGLGQVTPDTVAGLYAQRSIRQDDAERLMGNSVTLADWARGRAFGAGLAVEDADQAADLSNTLRSVRWGAGHPDANDGTTFDAAGREAATQAASAFAGKGPVQASLASLIVDMEASRDTAGFSMGALYVRDADRVEALRSSGLDRDNPGADLIASPEQETQADQQQATHADAVQMPTMIRESSPALQAPSTERTYIAVPYAEKDDAKQLGAKWDRAEKSWFVPAGVDTEAFAQWMPAKGSVHIAVDADPVEQFAQALRDAGLKVNGAPKMDGELHRVPVEGDGLRERSGAYKGHLDGRPAGFVQNHKTGTRENWKATGQASALTVQDRAQMAADAAQKRHDRAHEREQQAERTSQQVDAMWAAATPVQAHPYLADKGVQDHGLRQGAPDQTVTVNGADDRPRELSVAGQLFVPVADETGKLTSLQFIRQDGTKMFMPEGKVEGGHYVIGDAGKGGPVLIAEGFATAATLHEMTGLPAIVAFNAGNLRPVAEAYRALDPTRAIYIAGDDDKHREAERDRQGRPKVNVGRVKAEEAAAAIGGQAVFPIFPDNTPGTDWNDLAKGQGRAQAAAQLRGAIAVADREQAVQGLSAAREDAGLEQDHSLSKSIGQALGRIGKAFGRDRDKSQVQEMGHGR